MSRVNRDALRKRRDRAHGIILQTPALHLVEERRVFARTVVDFSVGRVGIDRSGEKLTRLAVNADFLIQVSRRKERVDVEAVVRVEEKSAARLVDHGENAVDGTIQAHAALDLTLARLATELRSAHAPLHRIAALPVRNVAGDPVLGAVVGREVLSAAGLNIKTLLQRSVGLHPVAGERIRHFVTAMDGVGFTGGARCKNRIGQNLLPLAVDRVAVFVETGDRQLPEIAPALRRGEIG